MNVCKIRYKEGEPNSIQVLEGDPEKCRALFKKTIKSQTEE